MHFVHYSRRIFVYGMYQPLRYLWKLFTVSSTALIGFCFVLQSVLPSVQWVQSTKGNICVLGYWFSTVNQVNQHAWVCQPLKRSYSLLHRLSTPWVRKSIPAWCHHWAVERCFLQWILTMYHEMILLSAQCVLTARDCVPVKLQHWFHQWS